MPTLSELGFAVDRICECIVTTYNEDGSPNAAPMGVRGFSEKELSMRIHTDHDTFANLLRMRACVVNIVHDPYLFLRTALLGKGKGGGEPEVSPGEVAATKAVDAPHLKAATAYVEAELISHEERTIEDKYGRNKVSNVRLKVRRITAKVKHPIAVNRGLSAAIELAIRLSRGEKDELDGYLGIMKKTLGANEFARIKDFLDDYLARSRF